MTIDPDARHANVDKFLARYQPMELLFLASVIVLMGERISESPDQPAAAKHLRERLVGSIDRLRVDDPSVDPAAAAQVYEMAIAHAGAIMSAAEHVAGPQAR